MRRALPWLVVAACHHDHPVTPDAPAADAAPDAMIVPSPLAIEDGHASVARWAFPDAVVGHPSAITLFVHNRDAVATSPLALATDSPEFAIDPASACIGKALGAADLCEVKLRFTPGAAGTRSATLHVTGAPVPIDFPLVGSGLPPTPGLETDVDGLDFGTVELAYTSTIIVRLSNTTSTAIMIDPPTSSPDFEVLGSYQSEFVDPGTYIEIPIRFTPHDIGPTGGALVVTSRANTVMVSLAGVGVRRVVVGADPMTVGHVSSVPAGIDCGNGAGDCGALFVGSVTLTAEPAAGAAFAGWGLQASGSYSLDWEIPCETELSCTLPPSSPAYQRGAAAPQLVLPMFAQPDWRSVDFHVVGPGKVSIGSSFGGSYVAACSHDCTTYAPDNVMGFQADAFASTPHVFSGWQGACGTANECAVPDGAVQMTATFADDDHAVTTIRPPFPADRLAWAPDGDLVVAGGHIVSKLAPSGEVRWTVALPYTSASSPTLDLAVSSDAIYYLRSDTVDVRGNAVLHKLDMLGVPQWSRTFTRKQTCDSSPFVRSLALGQAGDIAVLLSGDMPAVDVLRSDGTARWSVGLDYNCRGIATSSDGSYFVLMPNASTFSSTDMLRYAADGTPLATFATIPGTSVGLAVNAGGEVAVHWNAAPTATTTPVVLAKLAADGTTVFQRTFSLPNNGNFGQVNDGVVFDPNGRLVAVRGLLALNPLVGAHLEVWTSSGSSVWSIDKAMATNTNSITNEDLFDVQAVAAATGRVAIAGRFNDSPWIEIFAPP